MPEYVQIGNLVLENPLQIETPSELTIIEFVTENEDQAILEVR